MRKNKGAAEVAVAAAERLRLFLERHRDIGRRTEPEFMTLGEILQSVHGDASGMNRQIIDTIGLLGDRENGVMADLRQLSENSLRELDLRRREISGNLAVMETISARLGSLVEQSNILDRLGLYLGVVGLNIGVESTRSPEILEMFSGAAQEVRQLAAKIRRVAGEIAADCRKEQQDQQEIVALVDKSLPALTGLAREAEQTVHEAVHCIEEIMDRALAALAEANGHTRAIAEQIGRIVMGIQLHDSMSQRIAHIVEALTPVGDSLDRLKSGLPPDERLACLASSRQLITLQCGQIEWIIDEIEEARSSSLLAFTTIDRQVEALARSFALLREAGGGSGTTEQADPLSLLQAALERLRHLLDEGAAMIGQLERSGHQTATMTDRLSGHMRNTENIRFDIHIKALNTIVMSARLGERGQSMEVLAQETKFLSDQAHGFVDQVTSMHATIASAVRELRLEDGRHDQKESKGAMLADSTRSISETLARFHREAAAAGEQANTLRCAIAKADDSLQFLERLAAELRDHRDQLRDVAEYIAPWVGETAPVDLGSEGSRLEELYTMDRERKVHGAVVGAAGTLPQSPCPGPDPEQEDDNVELF